MSSKFDRVIDLIEDNFIWIVLIVIVVVGGFVQCAEIRSEQEVKMKEK